jgi:hypothetical protein
VRFIDEHKGVFGVEPICRVLTGHGAPIAPSTYYAAKARLPSSRAVRDEQLKAEISGGARTGDRRLAPQQARCTTGDAPAGPAGCAA